MTTLIVYPDADPESTSIDGHVRRGGVLLRERRNERRGALLMFSNFRALHLAADPARLATHAATSFNLLVQTRAALKLWPNDTGRPCTK